MGYFLDSYHGLSYENFFLTELIKTQNAQVTALKSRNPRQLF